MTNTYSCRINPAERSTYVVWRKLKPYIYKLINHVPEQDKEDIYNDSYFYIDYALSHYNENKNCSLFTWIIKNLRWRIYDKLDRAKGLITLPQLNRIKDNQIKNFKFESSDVLFFDSNNLQYQLIGDKDVDSSELSLRILKDSVIKSMRVLSPSTKNIIELYFGLSDTGRRYNLNEIAEIYNTTYQAIAGKIKRAKAKMHKYMITHKINIGDLLDYEA